MNKDGKWMAGAVRTGHVVGLLGLALAIGLAVWAFTHRTAQSAGPDDGAWFKVVQAPLTINIVESGTITPREKQIIKSEIEGRPTILYLIPEGTHVKVGELLVELDASDLMDRKVDQEIRVQNAEAAYIQAREGLEVVKNQARSDIDRAKLTLRFAREDVEQYNAGEYPNILKEREARITLAREDLQRAAEKVKWSKVLFAEKYLSESELRADELAARKAELDLALAEDNLRLLKVFTYKRKLAELDSELSQATLALERVERKAAADIIQAEAALRAKESEFKQQTNKLTKLTEQIGKARILAPRDGIVIYATSAQVSWRGNAEPLAEGQEVRQRQELIHFPTALTFDAEITVHESNLDRIRVGLFVTLTVDALPGRLFQGKIVSLAPLPDARSMFMNPDLKLYATRVRIDGGGDVLRTGMSCQADIHVTQFEAAVQVPVQTVVRIGGIPTVYVRESGRAVPRAVEIGLDNNRMVQVTGGLAAGEEVLLAPPLVAAPSASAAQPDAGLRPPTGQPPLAAAAGREAGLGAERQAPPAATEPDGRRGGTADGPRRRTGGERPPRRVPAQERTP
jgi:HlyD family secretion protein